MPRAPSALSLLLLMAALAFAATSPAAEISTPDDNNNNKRENQNRNRNRDKQMQMQMEESREPLKIINPWLSACDLQPASATDLKGACSAMWGPGPRCPPQCEQPYNNNSSTQCLFYLKESHKKEVCGRDTSTEHRRRALQGLRMRHCCEHAVDAALPEEALQKKESCEPLLDALLAVDALVARILCEFAEVLYRYDCGQKYSIKHQCEDCKEAYRKWVCSSLVPHYYNHTRRRVRPCLDVCQNVEQKCPYLLPGDRAPAYPTQYAGEPTFICLDPNIPEMGEQRQKSSVGNEDCCYSHCDSHGRGVLLNDDGEGAIVVRDSKIIRKSERLCVQCPGGPGDSPETAVNCSITSGTIGGGGGTPPATSTATCTALIASSPSSSRSSSTSYSTSSSTSSTAKAAATGSGVVTSGTPTMSRTLNKVLSMWTAWIILIHTVTNNNNSTMIMMMIIILLRYLLVLCATSVRTSVQYILTVNKWRKKPWS